MPSRQDARPIHGVPQEPAPTRALTVAFWACIGVAAAVVIRRVIALASPAPHPGAPPQLAALDQVFASHAALTLAHILPALAFVLIAPFLFLRITRDAAWVPRVLLVLGCVVGITAYAMSAYAVGGWVERSAVLVFNSLFLFSLYRAYVHMTRNQALECRRWMMRALAILLGIATTRPVMGVFFATSRWTQLTPQQFFGLAFWIGFAINTLAMEVWLRRHPHSIA